MYFKVVAFLLCLSTAKAFDNSTNITGYQLSSDLEPQEDNLNGIFDGVYSECFLYLSYSCLQKKTLLYLKELNKLSEVSVIGDYVKFVKTNETEEFSVYDNGEEEKAPSRNGEDLSNLIDTAIDKFFNNHVLKFSALGKDIAVPNTVDEFVGRKRKGGGGGGGHGGDDGGKKKMMMMAMMCMKMKLMMMIPAMMGMMGMMSFKGMMFSMMSFMMSKMMLLMKILEKKGGGGGGGDGGWAAGGGGGGGAWMPAGGDYGGGGGGGGGYDANGQWQSRSILERHPEPNEYYTEDIQERLVNKPIVSYVAPIVRYNNNVNPKKPYNIVKKLNDEVIKLSQDIKSRSKRATYNKNQYTTYNTRTNDNDSEKSKGFGDNRNGANSVPFYPYDAIRKSLETDSEMLESNIESKNVEVTLEPILDQQTTEQSNKNNIFKAEMQINDMSVSFDDEAPYSYEIDTDYAEDHRIKGLQYPPSNAGHKDFTKMFAMDRSDLPKTRNKRGIVDILQSAYIYWINRILGMANYRKNYPKFPKYKVVNGVKYVYYPMRQVVVPKPKTPKDIQPTAVVNSVANPVKEEEGFRPIVTEEFKPITIDDFNKGEIVEGAAESRMNKKMQQFKETVNEAMEDSPWQ